ncbi:hypothetical protein GDO81_013990 [Engystomops pustulosus]|uniref:Secreted protein n=1 Tax=Engystomops pustulosus TaxID=76066 RepID=A0AAV7B7D1_ENGPU|nr:hypothetical protein GDO81_013990 [Engystomops pustulosus]
MWWRVPVLMLLCSRLMLMRALSLVDWRLWLMARPPSSPMWLSSRSRLSRERFSWMTSATSLAPESPRLFSSSSRWVRFVFLFSASNSSSQASQDTAELCARQSCRRGGLSSRKAATLLRPSVAK